MICAQRLRLLLLAFLLPVSSFGQLSLTDTLVIRSSSSSYQLSHEFVIEKSETVIVHPLGLLKRVTDYEIDYRYGTLAFSESTLVRISAEGSLTAVVSYQALPLAFKREYALRRAVTTIDSSGEKRQTALSSQTTLSVDDFFESSLQRSGSIVRGFTLGSNRDLSLTSGFRMQLAGKLSSEVDVVAALTDEHSPIQPEGTTQTLQEVDQVFVEVRSPSVGATLGDFNIKVDRDVGGEFGRVFRKVQGAQGTAHSSQVLGGGTNASVSVAGAVGRGKYHSMQFQGSEGNQGPYRLSGKNGERLVIIVAGSERVYLNGELMSRGETNDYAIDYGAAEITFSSRRLITNASRITIDFEYSDRQYERNFLNASASAALLGDRLTFNATMTQEADDVDSPIDVSLDDTKREILRQSGADRFKASLNGAKYAGRDSITSFGQGQYVRRDTTVDGRQYSYFLYAPGDSNAVYSVSFSYVDAMPSDSLGYVRVGLGHFRVAGIGAGNYLPLEFVPLPQLLRTVDLNAKARVLRDVSVEGELALSQNDRNRLSSLDDGSKNGQAYRFGVEYHPREIMVGGMDLGEAHISFTERFVGERFLSLDRANEIEFGRKWNFDILPSSDEKIREWSLMYRPFPAATLSGEYGSLVRHDLLKSQRLAAEVTLADSALPSAQYKVEEIKSDDLRSRRSSSWLRQGGHLDRWIGPIKPGIRVESEERLLHGAADSLANGSFRILEISPRVETGLVSRMRASAEFQVRSEDSAFGGRLHQSFKSVTQQYGWTLEEWNNLTTSLTLSLRRTQFSESAKQRGNSNSDVALVRSQTRFAPLQRAAQLDVLYEFSNQRSARLEKVFVRVAKGNGNYRYQGDLNGNNLPDENEFELTRFDGDYIVVLIPGETLYPVADVKASARLRLQPDRLVHEPSGSFAQILSALSTETYFRVDERNSDPVSRNIAFLRLSTFLDNDRTISGSQLFTQDLHVFEGQRDLSFRFRFNQRKGLVQLISATERSYMRERSVRVRSQWTAEVANQTDFVNKQDAVTASISTARERDITSNTITSDFSYRPFREWEIGFRFESGRATDRYGGDDAVADQNEQSLRIVYAFLTKGQLRTEFRREEVVLTQPSRDASRVLPYEFTNGRVIGKSYLWSLAFDYRLTRNLQFTAKYDGRTEGGRRPVHIARAEAKAFF